MYCTNEILKKLNASRGSERVLKESLTNNKITLPDIMVRTFVEVKALADDVLTWGEINFLYQQAQKELKENKMAESRILTRANPQLANAVRLGIRQSSMLSNYDNLLPARVEQFVKSGSVASMFSPAAYLTELYREARNLHADTSNYHLDIRRPDLAILPLSQANMDDEVSTLSLSNDLLLSNIQKQQILDRDGVLHMLASYRQTGDTPYNHYYKATRDSILLQDPKFDAFRNNPVVASKIDTSLLLSIQERISPELHKILTEEITDDNAENLLKKNYGDTNLDAFRSIAYLASWYGISHDEMNSLLGMVTPSSNMAEGVHFYQNDQLISLVENDGNLDAVLMKRTAGTNYNQFGHIELIPVSGNVYQLRFTVKTGYAGEGCPVNIGTRGVESSDLLSDGHIPDLNVPFSLNVTLDSTKLANGITISVTRYNSSKEKGHYASVLFQKNDYSYNTYLLKLNKLIRLYKATGISPYDIRSIIESSNNKLQITSAVLSQMFWVNYYMQRYGIEVSAALVLAGSAIGKMTHSNQYSAFTRLFNMPMLNNTEFSDDGTAIKLTPSGSSDTFRTGVIKRAFGVNDAELYTLWTLVFGSLTPPEFTCTIENLSALYRICLLADVHNLSVTELAALLSVSPYASTPIGSLSVDQLSTLVGFADQYTSWLKDMNWTVSDLYLMLTNRYNTTLSPDIENLLTTLTSGLYGQKFNNAEEVTAIIASAPFIAASTQLESAEIATAILQWLSQLKPQGLTVSDFLALATRNDRTKNETIALVSYCQVLGQLTLIARNTGFSAAMLLWVVSHPTVVTSNGTVLKHSIDTLYDLTQLHTFLSRCGTRAAEIITSLSGKIGDTNNNLSVATVAEALDLDEQALIQALAQCSASTNFYNWRGLAGALQWMNVASVFGITPEDVATLVNLKPDSVHEDWVAASHILQSGLTSQQTAQLNDMLDETLGAAASGFVIKNIAPSWVTNRDQLYSWLLIDNQVSAKIKTTRIAEAIASMQLYVNRALSGQEEDVDYTIKSKKFFSTDWDIYNKRYSTWAGVSQMVYYPENYVDPTLRIGQTGMMDEMLQTLSQSQLTNDTVENAFKTYMTRFEEIANLDIISGYHEGSSDQNGTTWLVGKSAAGEYYWRSADIEKMSEGKLPANAWTEWKKVTAALNPVNNLVRPVIFQSRLYLTWVESREAAAANDNGTHKITEYLLNFAHILHDGTWSAPISVPLKDGVLPIKEVNIDDTGMYCAKDGELEKLYVYFYKKADNYSKLPDDIAGVCLYQDGRTENISADSAAYMTGYIYRQLDTTSAVRLNTPYTGGNTQVGISDARKIDFAWGDGNYTIMNSGSVKGISATVSDDNVVLHFNSVARVVYNGLEGSSSRTQVDMMHSVGSMGDTFYLPGTKQRSNTAYRSGRDFEYIIKNDNAHYVLVLDGIPSVSSDAIYLYQYNSTNYLNTSDKTEMRRLYGGTKNKKLWSALISGIKPENYVYALMSPQGDQYRTPNELLFGNFKKIDTAIEVGDVKLSVSGAATGSYEADNFSKYSLGESLFNFINKTVSVPFSMFRNNTAELTFAMSATAPAGDGRFLGKEVFTVTLTRTDESSMPVISLNKTNDGAQYLQYGFYRLRVNTLFAKQLVARANKGLNAVLSMETQLIEEPKLGDGSYVEVSFGRYDENTHGDGSYTLYLIGWEDVDNTRSKMKLTSGIISPQEDTSVRVFIPYNPDKTGDEKDMFYIGVKYSHADYDSSYTHMQSFTYNKTKKGFIANSDNLGRTPGLSSLVMDTEPMDFNGANALYFWEMFYYVPMMVFKRLLSESKYPEALQWLKYIWNPDGYFVDDQPASWVWNVRPMEEETTWHTDPLDSVDPDAVAQADPLHYKVATFMCYLDLLIARGDAAYRQLERDTLNEAKMCYVQALDILGDEPYLAESMSWPSPRLTEAADKVTQTRTQQTLLAVRQQIASGDLRTANSLTDLFLPQQNEKLAGYWQTLAQRLYNLRHNLSIDGSPLSLSVYSTPADPAALLSAAVLGFQGGDDLPKTEMPSYRFPVMLESARSMVGQLMHFGSTLLSISERQDAEALSELLQTQGAELVLQSIALQNNTISEIDADRIALEASLSSAQSRLDSYTKLYDEDVNAGEKQAMDLALAASVLSTTATTAYTVAAGLDAVPNIYGLAFGGSRWGSISRAVGNGIEIAAGASRTAAERLSQSEFYRRRRQDWETQRNAAQSEVDQINAQLDSLAVRRQGAVLQKTYLETQQSQTQAQMTFLQNKFTSKALYNWLRGKLAAIYYQFYDLSVSRCLMTQKAYQWALGNDVSFIRPGAWQGTYAGLMAGETLMLNLAQMEQSYLEKDQREKEVMRTVCLSEFYAGLSSDAFTLADHLVKLVNDGSGNAGATGNGLSVTSDKQLQAKLTLSDLKMIDDYPSTLGNIRRIKQISVTLPALVGPYQDVRAVLSYGGGLSLPRGCKATAVSHGMNDSGQFQLDFNDNRWLPFEGIPIDDSGSLTLSFPQANSSQKDLLLSLTDIILHIRYTITNNVS